MMPTAVRVAALLFSTALLPVAAACDADPTAQDTAVLAVMGSAARSGLAGLPLPDSLVVQLVDGDGQPIPGRSVTWTATGDDAVSAPATVTDSLGRAAIRIHLGPGLSADTVVADHAGSSAAFFVSGEAISAGTTYTGRGGYVTYEAGTLPLVIAAPHGGTLEPDEIPDRTTGTQVRDADTDLLAAAMADALEQRLGERPHVVTLHLARTKLDANRSLDEGSEHPLADQTWEEFQGFVEAATDHVAATHGAGFFIDLHGHGHEILRLELGYALSADDLALSDATLDAGDYAASSSLRSLATTSDSAFSAILRGAGSLGGRFEAAGVPAVPSPPQPDPGTDPYFTGGYNTRTHGSREGGTIDGVQIEAHRTGLRDTEANRAAFAEAAAVVLEAFLATYYGFTAQR